MNSDKEAMDSETITQRSPLHGLDPLDSEVLDCIEVAWEFFKNWPPCVGSADHYVPKPTTYSLTLPTCHLPFPQVPPNISPVSSKHTFGPFFAAIRSWGRNNVQIMPTRPATIPRIYALSIASTMARITAPFISAVKLLNKLFDVPPTMFFSTTVGVPGRITASLEAATLTTMVSPMATHTEPPKTCAVERNPIACPIRWVGIFEGITENPTCA